MKAVRALTAFLEKEMLSDSDIEIFIKIAELSFSEHRVLNDYFHKILKALWKSDFISPEKKLDVFYKVAEGLPDVQYGRKRAISVLRAGANSGLPLDYDIIQIVVDKAVAEPDISETVEDFVKYALEPGVSNLSIDERSIVFLEMEKMRSLKISSSRQNRGANKACREAMQSKASPK